MSLNIVSKYLYNYFNFFQVRIPHSYILQIYTFREMYRFCLYTCRVAHLGSAPARFYDRQIPSDVFRDGLCSCPKYCRAARAILWTSEVFENLYISRNVQISACLHICPVAHLDSAPARSCGRLTPLTMLRDGVRKC